MSKRKPLVIVTRKLPDAVETRMMELFTTRLNADDHALSKTELTDADVGQGAIEHLRYEEDGKDQNFLTPHGEDVSKTSSAKTH